MSKAYAFVVNARRGSAVRTLHGRGVGAPAGYSRSWDLPRLLAIWPDEVAESIGSRERLLDKLERALRAERQRGIAGHWTYDVARHSQLVAAYRAEKAELAEIRRRRPGRRQPAAAAARREGC